MAISCRNIRSFCFLLISNTIAYYHISIINISFVWFREKSGIRIDTNIIRHQVTFSICITHTVQCGSHCWAAVFRHATDKKSLVSHDQRNKNPHHFALGISNEKYYSQSQSSSPHTEVSCRRKSLPLSDTKELDIELCTRPYLIIYPFAIGICMYMVGISLE